MWRTVLENSILNCQIVYPCIANTCQQNKHCNQIWYSTNVRVTVMIMCMPRVVHQEPHVSRRRSFTPTSVQLGVVGFVFLYIHLSYLKALLFISIMEFFSRLECVSMIYLPALKHHSSKSQCAC